MKKENLILTQTSTFQEMDKSIKKALSKNGELELHSYNSSNLTEDQAYELSRMLKSLKPEIKIEASQISVVDLILLFSTELSKRSVDVNVKINWNDMANDTSDLEKLIKHLVGSPGNSFSYKKIEKLFDTNKEFTNKGWETYFTSFGTPVNIPKKKSTNQKADPTKVSVESGNKPVKEDLATGIESDKKDSGKRATKKTTKSTSKRSESKPTLKSRGRPKKEVNTIKK